MRLSLGLDCVPRMEMEQVLTMIKGCPWCGAENDLGRFYSDKMHRHARGAIPLCFSCEKPLWKTEIEYVKWNTRRIIPREEE